MSIASEADFIGLSRAGRAVADALTEMRRYLRAGMTTGELDAIGARVLARHGARSAPQLVYGFPGVNLISVNEEAVHGIPGDRVIREGDLVSLDVTAELDGYMSDAAVTVAVPPASDNARRLCDCSRIALGKAIDEARAGRPFRVIGGAVEREVVRRGFRVVRELSGHGIGRTIHEPPTIRNYYDPADTEPLTEGLVITIEPIITSGDGRIVEADDGWTVRTADGSLSAHHEHTVIIRRGRPLLLTAA